MHHSMQKDGIMQRNNAQGQSPSTSPNSAIKSDCASSNHHAKNRMMHKAEMQENSAV
jgi:hypothetical protein